MKTRARIHTLCAIFYWTFFTVVCDPTIELAQSLPETRKKYPGALFDALLKGSPLGDEVREVLLHALRMRVTVQLLVMRIVLA